MHGTGPGLLSGLPCLLSSNGNSSSWSSLGLEGEVCEEHLSFSPSDRSVIATTAKLSDAKPPKLGLPLDCGKNLSKAKRATLKTK